MRGIRSGTKKAAAGSGNGDGSVPDFQESLTNIMRHAEAHHVGVYLYEQNGNACLRVKEDDGKGFREAEFSGSLGLLGMRERAAGLRGRTSD